MHTKSTRSRDGLAVAYHVFGAGERPLVIVNAPGMSLRFWSTLIGSLAARRRVLAFDYRGLGADAALLTPAQATFACCRDDLEAMLAAEGVRQADFVSWCAGASIVAALHQRCHGLVGSLASIGVSADGSPEPAPFDATILQIAAAVDEDAACIDRMLLMMNRIGILPDESFFEALVRHAPPGGDRFGALSKSGYLLFDSPVRLRNYLRLFQDFDANRRSVLGACPAITLINGARGEAETRLRLHSGGLWEAIIPQESQFLLLERGRELCEQLEWHLERSRALTASPSAAPASLHVD